MKHGVGAASQQHPAREWNERVHPQRWRNAWRARHVTQTLGPKRDGDGAAVAEAVRNSRGENHLDANASPFACLLSLGVDVRGTWGLHFQKLVAHLVRTEGQTVAEVFRRTTERAHTQRWWSLEAVALQRAVAESILPGFGADPTAAEPQLVPLALADVLDACRG